MRSVPPALPASRASSASPAAARRACRLAVAVSTCGLLAACGTVTAGAAGSGTSVAHVAGSGLDPCQPTSLTVTVDVSQSSALAGSTFYPLDFTNTSGTACGMDGYPGVSFVTADGSSGRQIGMAAQQNPAYAKQAVQLPAGGVAHAWLQVAVAANYPASACRPVSARWLRIVPPQVNWAGYVSLESSACSSASAPTLIILPVRAGKGIRGTTP